MTRKAVCCCGTCSIEVAGEPTINAICHCSNCKQRTGSAFGWSAYFADEQVVAKLGDLRLYAIEDRQQRHFCARCGTTLFWKSNFMPSHTGVAGGCFIPEPFPEPSITANNAGRCAWLGLPETWQRYG
ncbi:MAG: GFA family protein [Alphaproteobacteria bacterium]